MTEKASYPQWVLDQKRPGTEVRRIRGLYHLKEFYGISREARNYAHVFNLLKIPVFNLTEQN